jgi:hypothetical protein
MHKVQLWMLSTRYEKSKTNNKKYLQEENITRRTGRSSSPAAHMADVTSDVSVPADDNDDNAGSDDSAATDSDDGSWSANEEYTCIDP